jgi:hypothetical protein
MTTAILAWRPASRRPPRLCLTHRRTSSDGGALASDLARFANRQRHGLLVVQVVQLRIRLRATRQEPGDQRTPHAPIVSDELFDRVQEVRSWRTRVVKPGRPSEEYLLRKLIHCERCGARMHGCRTGREAMRRYQRPAATTATASRG